MNAELFRNKRLICFLLIEAAVLTLIGVVLPRYVSGGIAVEYALMMCLSIPLFFTFSVLKCGSIRGKDLREITKRMFLFLLIFACLSVTSGALSGLAAVLIYSLLKDGNGIPEILTYASYASEAVTCLLYPFLAGFFVSLSGDSENFLREGLRLTAKRYLILLFIIFAAFGIGRLAESTDSVVLRTMISVSAGTLCLVFSLAVFPSDDKRTADEEERSASSVKSPASGEGKEPASCQR